MKEQACKSVSCCASVPWLGGIAAADFGVLDQMAVKLVCLDSEFAGPFRQIGRVVGERVAAEQGATPVPFDTALSALIPACGLAGVIDAQFLQRNAEGALLRITGCAAVLGWPIPNVERTVCGFDAGLFEGFLCGVTGDAWRVEETACLGFGKASCEFMIHRHNTLGEWEGVTHGRC